MKGFPGPGMEASGRLRHGAGGLKKILIALASLKSGLHRQKTSPAESDWRPLFSEAKAISIFLRQLAEIFNPLAPSLRENKGYKSSATPEGV
jgi:hypothetical protein